MTRRLFAGVLGAALLAACQAGPPRPGVLDAAHDQCAYCRMVVSDPRFASQVVAPYEEPRYFDDLGCLSGYLSTTPALPKGAVIYVADHRTKVWVRADQAVYTRLDAAAAPMGSRIVAHESAASRDADPEAARGAPLAIRDVFPAGHVPGGAS